MTVGIGGGGFMGLALEATQNTYVPPTVFFPIESESLQYQQATVWRRPLRQSADVIGGVPGDVHIEGDVNMEAFEEVIPYFLMACRTSVVKTGTTPGPFVYTFTPTAAAVPVKTMSLTVVRNDETFGYVGCVVGSYTFTVEDGQLKFNTSVLGSDEAAQTKPTAVWPDLLPFGAGTYSVEIPTATQVFDADGFEFTVDASADAQFRLKNTGRGAQFISYGENNTTLTTERDFLNRTEYDLFKTLTSRGITLRCERDADHYIEIRQTSSIIDTYEVGLSGQGDLIRASIAYQGTLDANGHSYEVEIGCDADLTVA